MTTDKQKRAAWGATGATLLLVCWCDAASAKEPFDWPAAVHWTPRFTGIDEAALTLSAPRPLRVHALRVDLSEEGVSVITDHDNGERPEETDGLKTSTFLLRRGCQAAINGAPFWPGQKEEDQPQNVVGLVVSEGRLVSPVDSTKPRAFLVVRDDGSAAIEHGTPDLSRIRTAVGGYGVVLQGGSVVRPANEQASFIDDRHPRTAVGIADAGRTLLLVVVDGRQAGYSEGVSLDELGRLLGRLGAKDGLNLDGGGTTTMVMDDGASGYRLVNRPINGGESGRQRVSASHLGVHARPLDAE